MFLRTALLASVLSMGCFATQAAHHVKRQGEGEIIFTTICLGPRCPQDPSETTKSTKTTTLKTTTSPKTTSTTSSKITSTSIKTPTKTTTPSQPTKTQTEEVGPSSTRCPVPLYYQCGGYHDGQPWTGCTKCVSGAKCIWQNDWYYQCVADN